MNLARYSLLPVFTFTVAVACSGAASAQTFEGEGAAALFQGLGLVEAEKPEIDLKERGPLVIPSTKDLPPPEAPRMGAAVDPNWPVDPDELKRQNEDTAQIWIEQNRSEPTLKGKELQGYTLPPGQKNHASGTPTDRQRVTLTPAEMAKSHRLLAKQENWAEVGEPERRVLSDPPPGYRAPVTSAPYQAAPTAKDNFWDKINIFKPK